MIDSLIAEQHYEDALSEFEISERLSTADSKTGTDFYRYARILDGLGRSEQAVAAYKKYLAWGNKYDPNSENVTFAKERLASLKHN
jgi:hypothetical protein